MRWACSRTCWVLIPSESVTPGLGVVVDIIWKMIQKCAGAISRWNTYWATSGGVKQSSLGSFYPTPPWPCGAAPGTRCPVSGPPHLKDRRMQGNWRGFSWRIVKMSFVTHSRCFGFCEERLRKLGGIFCPAERRLRCSLIAAWNWRAVSKVIEPT